jgi:polysaccharide biosynthesis protein PslG
MIRTNKKSLCWIVPALFVILCVSAYAQDQAIAREKNMDDSPFGVLEFLHWNDSWNNYKYPQEDSLRQAVSLMKEAGIGWVRVDFLWQLIEPEQGKFDFAKHDLIVDLLTAQGINILGILDYSADWASSCGKWNCAPKENKLFIDFATAVIRRYKDRIKYWELWNEPDSGVYWEPQDGLKAYCQLLREFYPAAKAADPQCKILNGGLAIANSSLNKLYDNGAGGYFDILNIHIFVTPLNNGAAKTVLAYPRLAYKIMKRNGDADKKIWITEIGCPGVGRNSNRVENWWLGKNPLERQQAQWVREIFPQLIKAEAVEKVFWAFFRDCDQHWRNGTDYFGLIRWDYSRKPAFKAYRQCVEEWRKGR